MTRRWTQRGYTCFAHVGFRLSWLSRSLRRRSCSQVAPTRFKTRKTRVLFGPVGIGVGQAARVNVYAIGNPNESPWLFIVRIFSRTGELVREGKFEVAPGAIGSFDINLGAGGISVPDRLGRRTIRAEIVGFNPQPDPPGKYVATLEVYSSLTGHTSILIGNPDEIPAQPPPDPN